VGGRHKYPHGVRARCWNAKHEVAARACEPLPAGLAWWTRKSGIGRVDERSHECRSRDKLTHDFQPFRRYVDIQLGHARDVSARSIETGDKTEFDWITCKFKVDRNFRGGRFGCKCGLRGSRDKHVYWTANQIGRHPWQSIGFTLRLTVFDGNVLSFDITNFCKTL